MDRNELTIDQLLAKNADLQLRLAELKDAESRAQMADDRLREVAAGISAQTGPLFFQSLAEYLVRALDDVDIALVGELINKGTDSVHVLGLAGLDRAGGCGGGGSGPVLVLRAA